MACLNKMPEREVWIQTKYKMFFAGNGRWVASPFTREREGEGLYEGEEPKPDLSQFSEDQQVYHSALLIEAKLVDGSILNDETGYPRGTAVLRLTWDGHEFLDAARNESAWRAIRKKAVTAGVTLTFPILKHLLSRYIQEKLGFPTDE